jgi:chemotaxis-related protein WspD
MPETPIGLPTSTLNHCWQSIGVQGDRSCPELQELSHCRNCTIYAAAGRDLLNQPFPTGYQEEWAVLLAVPTEASVAQRTASLAIFRLQDEWFGLSAAVFEAVTPIGPVRQIPQRRNAVLLGLVNISGELQLCADLAALLDIPIGSAGQGHPRMVVVQLAGGRWVFPVDEIYGIERFDMADIKPAPAHVSPSQQPLTRGVIQWRGNFLSYLDDAMLSHSLQRRALV